MPLLRLFVKPGCRCDDQWIIMLLVLAFHPGTAGLALCQLRVIERFGKFNEHRLLFHVPEGCSTEQHTEIANRYFRCVQTNSYSDPHSKTPAPWPQPQNWAWAEAGRYCNSTRFPDEVAWFWWEADVTPLVAEWADSLETIYKSQQRPFMGGYVHGLGGHMNGVAVYPMDVANHVGVDPFIVRNRPFDMVLSERLHQDNVHDIRKHLFHYPRLNGAQCRVEDLSVVTALRDKGIILLHGSNDGSLPSLLLNEPLPAIDPARPLVIINDDAVNNEVEPADVLHQQDQSRLQKDGWMFVSRKDCKRDVQSLAIQSLRHAIETDIFPLPLSKLECSFNPTICRGSDGKLHLVYRRWQRRSPTTGVWQSTLVRTTVDEQTLRFTSPLRIVETHRSKSDEQHEDPRLIQYGGNFFLSYVQWRHHAKRYIAHQSLGMFNQTWNHLRTFHVPFGGNGSSPKVGNGHEKNWVWFNLNQNLYLLYSFHPHVVAQVDGEKVVSKFETSSLEAVKHWQWGEVRGGSPPILLPKQYQLDPDVPEFITFHHSSLWWRKRQKRYHMGAYTFAARPPFEVLRITPNPILSGSEQNSRTLGGPLVVFPGGAVLTNNNTEALVVYGVNDEQCAWSKIPLDWLCSTMVK